EARWPDLARALKISEQLPMGPPTFLPSNAALSPSRLNFVIPSAPWFCREEWLVGFPWSDHLGVLASLSWPEALKPKNPWKFNATMSADPVVVQAVCQLAASPLRENGATEGR